MIARTGRALTIAAVAGRRADFALLEAVTGLSEAELPAAVEELVAAQLLIEESARRSRATTSRPAGSSRTRSTWRAPAR